VGGIKDEEYVFTGKISQLGRKAREEAGVDSGGSQDIDNELSHFKKQATIQGAGA